MLKIPPFNKRQERILSFLEESRKPAAMSDLLKEVQGGGSQVSRMTVNRDLRMLSERGYVKKTGAGRGAMYTLSSTYQAVRPVDAEAYFKIDPDQRQIQQRFNFGVFSLFDPAFTDSELRQLEKWNELYQAHVKKLSATLLKREYERLTIELSWKSSKIEGNTYTLLETEYLLKEHKEPKGHTHEEAVMILNHKIALDYIRAHERLFRTIDVRKIEEVHSLLVDDLGVARNIRSSLVRIGGTAYRPLDNKFQIREALDQMCRAVNKQKNPFAKALMAMLLIAYIQPFEDGNKRTSRLLGNALLLAYHACPLSFRSIDELAYKKAILLFYEQNNFRYFKELFMEQFEFAVKNYFG